MIRRRRRIVVITIVLIALPVRIARTRHAGPMHQQLPLRDILYNRRSAYPRARLLKLSLLPLLAWESQRGWKSGVEIPSLPVSAYMFHMH